MDNQPTPDAIPTPCDAAPSEISDQPQRQDTASDAKDKQEPRDDKTGKQKRYRRNSKADKKRKPKGKSTERSSSAKRSSTFPEFKQILALLSRKSGASLKPREMSPEVTLAEFISTSAGFFEIPNQKLETLEDDILKVFPNNVLPANAAAWYLAKRKFYLDRPPQFQLLPHVLSNHPKMFRVEDSNSGGRVHFLEKYDRKVAKHKLEYLVQQGLFAYFSHKAEEFGVYFFDPIFYEETEPFCSNLKVATEQMKMERGQSLLEVYFKMFKRHFHFVKHSAYLMSISKTHTPRLTNQIGIVVSMFNKEFGLIKFANKKGEHQVALFNAKTLYKDGYHLDIDVNSLPTIFFDGYKVPNEAGKEDMKYSWYAVLVWCGRKPTPKVCATREMLKASSSPHFFHNKSVTYEELAEIATSQQRTVDGHPPSTQQVVDDGMKVGEVINIYPNGAVVALHKQKEKKVFIPGWMHTLQSGRSGKKQLTMVQGNTLGKGDLIAFYLSTGTKLVDSMKAKGSGVGHNIIVLRRADSGQQAMSLDMETSNKREKARQRDSKKNSESQDRKGSRRKRTSESGVSESKSEKSGKRSSKRPSKYLTFLLTDEALEEDGYASEIDPAYLPPQYIERDFDFDEISESDISESEVEDIVKDKDCSLEESKLMLLPPPVQETSNEENKEKPEDSKDEASSGEQNDGAKERPRRPPHWFTFLTTAELDKEPEHDKSRLYFAPWSVRQQMLEEAGDYREMYNFRHPRIQFPVEEKPESEEKEPAEATAEDQAEEEVKPDPDDEIEDEELEALTKEVDIPLKDLIGDYLNHLAEEEEAKSAAKKIEGAGDKEAKDLGLDKSGVKGADLPTAAGIAAEVVC